MLQSVRQKPRARRRQRRTRSRDLPFHANGDATKRLRSFARLLPAVKQRDDDSRNGSTGNRGFPDRAHQQIGCGDVTDHRAATLGSPQVIRLTSPLRCIGLSSARVVRSDGLTLQVEPERHVSRLQYHRCIEQGSAAGQHEVRRGFGYVSSSFPPRNSIGVQISMPDRPSSSSNR